MTLLLRSQRHLKHAVLRELSVTTSRSPPKYWLGSGKTTRRWWRHGPSFVGKKLLLALRKTYLKKCLWNIVYFLFALGQTTAATWVERAWDRLEEAGRFRELQLSIFLALRRSFVVFFSNFFISYHARTFTTTTKNPYRILLKMGRDKIKVEMEEADEYGCCACCSFTCVYCWTKT